MNTLYELDADIALERTADGSFRGEVTDRWTTVSQPNGGYVLGFALGALRASLPQPDPVSSSAHFLRPATPGPIRVEVDVARIGRSLSTASARLIQKDKEILRVLATFGDLSTESPRHRTITPPPLPPFEAMPDARRPPAGLPEIAYRYAHRVLPEAFGWMRGEPSGRTEKLGYLLFRDGRPPDTLCLPVLADCLPPSVGNVLPTAFTPTVELSVQVRARPAPGPIAARFVTRELSHGYFEEDGDLWDSRGELVALSRQLLKYYPPSDRPLRVE